MAVKLPSDLIIDVMRNADPARHRAALARLETASVAAEKRVAFNEVIGALEPAHAASSGPVLSLPFSEGRNAAREIEAPYQDFEKMVLRNLFESLLPDSESGVFGTGPSAGVWRSMAADEMAGVYAGAGGVGIARVLSEEGVSAPSRQAQWPYFKLTHINGFSG